MEESNNNKGEQYSTVTGNEDLDSMLTWIFSTDTDAIELSKVLEASEENTYQTKVKIISDPSWHPLTFQTAASYITINGNEELCGSSFSDSDTSYMVGIANVCGGAWRCVAEEARGWIEVEEDGNCLVSGLTNPKTIRNEYYRSTNEFDNAFNTILRTL